METLASYCSWCTISEVEISYHGSLPSEFLESVPALWNCYQDQVVWIMLISFMIREKAIKENCYLPSGMD